MLIFEALSAIFMFRKFIDGARVLPQFNTIMNALHWSMVKLFAFLGGMLTVWGMTVLLGAAIWGQTYYSFKAWDHAINASCMMFYGKMEFIRDGQGAQMWIFIFVFIWFVFFFISRGAFFKLQVISVKMIAITSGFIDPNFFQ